MGHGIEATFKLQLNSHDRMICLLSQGEDTCNTSLFSQKNQKKWLQGKSGFCVKFNMRYVSELKASCASAKVRIRKSTAEHQPRHRHIVYLVRCTTRFEFIPVSQLESRRMMVAKAHYICLLFSISNYQVVFDTHNSSCALLFFLHIQGQPSNTQHFND